MSFVVVIGSPSRASKTAALARVTLDLVDAADVIELAALDADALLVRRKDAALDEALARAASASVLVLATPVYRATYSGLLKTFLDQLPPGALRRTAVVLLATAGIPDHFLSLDTGLRAVVASLGGWTVPTVVYAVGDDFDVEGVPQARVRGLVQDALDEAGRVARVLADESVNRTAGAES